MLSPPIELVRKQLRAGMILYVIFVNLNSFSFISIDVSGSKSDSDAIIVYVLRLIWIWVYSRTSCSESQRSEHLDLVFPSCCSCWSIYFIRPTFESFVAVLSFAAVRCALNIYFGWNDREITTSKRMYYF